jgi:hypothetical protein
LLAADGAAGRCARLVKTVAGLGCSGAAGSGSETGGGSSVSGTLGGRLDSKSPTTTMPVMAPTPINNFDSLLMISACN